MIRGDQEQQDDNGDQQMDTETFQDIQEFVKGEERTKQDYSDNSVTLLLYEFLCEFYRKLNVKNTMSTVFHKI